MMVNDSSLYKLDNNKIQGITAKNNSQLPDLLLCFSRQMLQSIANLIPELCCQIASISQTI